MKKNYTFKLLIVLLFFSAQLFSQVNVTFKIDMSNQTVSSDGVHVVGSINDWSTDATIFTQEGSTNIYTATVSLNTGWHEYKFLNGNAWGTEEQAGYPCAPSNGNRFLYINDSGNDVTLEAVPFNGCNADGTGFSFSLNLDMSGEANVSADGVHMTGAFNGWNPDNFNIPDVNGNIHSATLRLPTPSDYSISFEYKFLNGKGWGNEETPDPNCGTVANNNRVETITSSGQNIYNIFNGCNYTLATGDFSTNSLKTIYNQNERTVNFFSDSFNNGIAKVQVFDITGKSIKNINEITSINEIEIDFKSNNNGIYFVRIESQGKQFVKKIIIY